MADGEVRTPITIEVAAGQPPSQQRFPEIVTQGLRVDLDKPSTSPVVHQLGSHPVCLPQLREVVDMAVGHDQVEPPVEIGVEELRSESEHLPAGFP